MKYSIFIFVVSLVLGLSGCSQRPVEYQVDPFIDSRVLDSVDNLTMMVKVIAPNKDQHSSKTKDPSKQPLNPSNDFAKNIKANIIASLIERGFKISSNQHFSDVSMEFDFSQVEVMIEKGAVRDRLSAEAKLTVEVVRKPKTVRKTFQRSQRLDVALTATQPEITGLTNQVIGELINSAFSDPELVAFLKSDIR